LQAIAVHPDSPVMSAAEPPLKPCGYYDLRKEYRYNAADDRQLTEKIEGSKPS